MFPPQVRMAKPHVRCPIPECSGYLEEGLVVSHLSSEDVVKYRYFVELSQLDSSTKPCPQCSVFTTLKEHNPIRSEHKYKVLNCAVPRRRRQKSEPGSDDGVVLTLSAPCCRYSAATASSCGASDVTRLGTTGSNAASTEKTTSCYEPGRVS